MSIRKIVPIEQTEWGIAPPSSWMVAREPDWDFAPAQEHHAIAVLLIDEQHHVATQASAHRTVRRLLTHAAVQALGQVALDFDPAAHRLWIHDLAVWRRDRDGAWAKRSLAEPGAFLLRQREQQLEQQMLHGRVSVVALLEDVQVGDAIDLSWTLEPRDSLPGLHFTAYFAWVWSVPVARAFFTLHRQDAEQVTWRMHAQEGVAVPQEEITPERATWSLERATPTELEPNAPGSDWPYALLDVSGWRSWEEVAEFIGNLWGDALAEGAATVAGEAARLAVEGDPVASARAAIRFVQEEARYLAVDFGHGGGLLPNGAATVLRRRFGDCKDKSVLLTALLRAMGLDAWPVLVAPNWRTAVARVQPSTSAFSHAIVGCEVAGRKIFVDPTLVGEGGDFSRMAPPAYGFGLEVRPGTSGLTPLPERSPAELALREVFTLDPRGAAGMVEQTLRATNWMANQARAALLGQGRAAFFKARGEALQKHFPAAVLREDSIRVADDFSGNILTLFATYDLPTWGHREDKPPAAFSYGAHGLLLAIETLDGPERRRQPWVLPHPVRAHHHLEVRGSTVRRTKPERFFVVSPGFRYDVELSARKRCVTFDYRWETTRPEIAAGDWPAYVRDRTRAFERAGATVATPSGWRAQKALVARLGLAAIIVAAVAAGILSPSESRESRRQAVPRIEQKMRTATNALQAGEFETAARLLEELRPHYAGSASFHTMRAEAALRLGRIGTAQEALTAARRIDPENQPADLLEAELRERQGDLAGAKEVREKTIARAPGDGRVLFQMALLLERMGDQRATRSAWERFLNIAPANAEALQHYARLLWEAGERERADATILGLSRAQPTPSAAMEMVISHYFALTGRTAEALQAAARATELAPDDPKVAYQHVMALARAGQNAEALAQAQQMARRFPTKAQSWAALAPAAATAGDTTTAERAFREWLRVDPGNADAPASYGFFLHQTKRDNEARVVLEKATRDYPGSGLAWLNYAVVLEALGDQVAAPAAREKAAALLPAAQRATLLR